MIVAETSLQTQRRAFVPLRSASPRCDPHRGMRHSRSGHKYRLGARAHARTETAMAMADEWMIHSTRTYYINMVIFHSYVN